jgi:hypothetical protein
MNWNLDVYEAALSVGEVAGDLDVEERVDFGSVAGWEVTIGT